MSELKLPERTILLDGGMGRELRFRDVDVMTSIWSAKALIDAPQVVCEVHRDFITAGADIITINSYGIVKMKYVGGYANTFQPIPDRTPIKKGPAKPPISATQ